MSNKLLLSILEAVYGHFSHIEYPLRDTNKLTVTTASTVPKLHTLGPDHLSANSLTKHTPVSAEVPSVTKSTTLAQHLQFGACASVALPSLKQTQRPTKTAESRGRYLRPQARQAVRAGIALWWRW